MAALEALGDFEYFVAHGIHFQYRYRIVFFDSCHMRLMLKNITKKDWHLRKKMNILTLSTSLSEVSLTFYSRHRLFELPFFFLLLNIELLFEEEEEEDSDEGSNRIRESRNEADITNFDETGDKDEK